MKIPYVVPKEKQIRLIINTDAKCEADDQYAIVHAVITPRFQIKGIIGAHFGTQSATAMEQSYDEMQTPSPVRRTIAMDQAETCSSSK